MPPVAVRVRLLAYPLLSEMETSKPLGGVTERFPVKPLAETVKLAAAEGVPKAVVVRAEIELVLEVMLPAGALTVKLWVAVAEL